MATRASNDQTSLFHGILLVDKPSGITSHDAVDEIRRIYNTRRVGHAGTLDPIADGLLVVMLGEATKLAEYLQSSDKQYQGTMRLGYESDTYDAEGAMRPGPGGKLPDADGCQELADELTGRIMQAPPPYSAKKVAGKKLYEYARAGKKVDVEAREIVVHDFEILEKNGDTVDFGVECSSGTYIRALVSEFGRRAGCGAVMTALRRTASGTFDVEDALTLDALRARATDVRALGECILPIRKAVPHFPAAWLAPGAEAWLRHGQAIPLALVELETPADAPGPPRLKKGQVVVLCRINGDAVALARVDPAPLSPPPKAIAQHPGPWFQPIKLFDLEGSAAIPDEPEAPAE